MNTDFAITKQTLDSLDNWVMAIAQPFLPLEARTIGRKGEEGIQWVFHEENAWAVIVGKLVRMASGLRAAFLLADTGLISECGTILRTVADFTTEVIAMAETVRTGAANDAQKRFIQQYFAPLAETPDDFDARERERYVARRDLVAAYVRWCSEFGKVDADSMRKTLMFLLYGFDKFVHGAYLTSSELYDPFNKRFMLRGHVFEGKRVEYKRTVASKLHEMVGLLAWISMLLNMPVLTEVIGKAALKLYDSGELM